jgi:hypothetical protein
MERQGREAADWSEEVIRDELRPQVRRRSDFFGA